MIINPSPSVLTQPSPSDEVCIQGLSLPVVSSVLEKYHHQPRYPLHLRSAGGIRVRDIAAPMPLVTAHPVSPGRGVRAVPQQGERLPLVDDASKLAGLITLKDFVKAEQYPRATKGRTAACVLAQLSASSVTATSA